MKPSEQKRFDRLYQRHLRALKLRGFSKSTIDVYARAVRRVAAYHDCCPDQLTVEQLEVYFAKLVDSHSWSTVKVDRNGLQFFWQHVLKKDWTWINIIRAPKVKTLPDILTLSEIDQLIGATRHLRFRIFLLTTYSMGLRLSETLALEVGDIDRDRGQVHIRRGTKSRRLKRGTQGSLCAPAGSHLPGFACPVVQTPPSATAVSQPDRFTRTDPCGQKPHGGRQRPVCHEGRGRRVRH